MLIAIGIHAFSNMQILKRHEALSTHYRKETSLVFKLQQDFTESPIQQIIP